VAKIKLLYDVKAGFTKVFSTDINVNRNVALKNGRNKKQCDVLGNNCGSGHNCPSGCRGLTNSTL
jgi:hypothetical protein